MAQCHLSHKIPWNNLKYCLKTDKTSILLPTGLCQKIHCKDRATEIKVRNRNFIDSKCICQESDCETIGETSFSKNKRQLPDLSKINCMDETQKKQFQYFCEQFAKTVFEFIESEKNKESDVSDLFIETCDLNQFVDPSIPCTECYGTCRDKVCSNFIVFNLFITGKISILLKLHKIGRVDIQRALEELYGGQAVGNGFEFLMDYHIFPFYIISNVIIICGYQDDSSKWGALTPDLYYNLYSRIQHDCDYKTFIPNLRYLLNKNVFMKNANDTQKLLKECFRCIYQYAYLEHEFYNLSEQKFCDNLKQELKYTLKFK